MGVRKTGTTTRRSVLKATGIGGLAVAAGIPLVNIARAQSQSIKIGVISCLSGIRADFGAADPWVIERIRPMVKNGLKIGAKTYAVEIVLKDNQSDANQTNVVANELILRERCDLVLTDDGENIAGAADALADARGVPLISTLSPWEAWMFGRHGDPRQGFPFTFHYCIGAGDVFNVYASMWNSVKTDKVVGTLYMDSPAGRGFADPQHGLPLVLKKNGYTEVPTGFFQLTNDDFTNQVSTFKAANCDIISGSVYASPFATFWNQAGQAGLKPLVVTIAGPFLFPSGVTALGDRGNGMSTEVLWNPHLPYRSTLTGQTARQLADEFEASTGKQWTQLLGYSHSLWEVGLAALKGTADPKDKNALRHSIATLDIDTILGPLNWKDSPIKSVAVAPLTGGQWRKTKGGKWPYELLIVNSGTSKAKPDDELRLLTQLS